MFLLVAPAECRERLRVLLSGDRSDGYTEIPTVYGEGDSGPRFGSRVYPGSSSIFFTVVRRSRARPLRDAIEEAIGACDLPVHAFEWSVDSVGSVPG